jgi:hypothetical protein
VSAESLGNFAAHAIAGLLWTPVSPTAAFTYAAAWMLIAFIAFTATRASHRWVRGGSESGRRIGGGVGRTTVELPRSRSMGSPRVDVSSRGRTVDLLRGKQTAQPSEPHSEMVRRTPVGGLAVQAVECWRRRHSRLRA